jgi:hypothetical protein
MMLEPYHYTLDKRQIELLESNEKGHYRIYWEDLPVGFIYRLELGIDVGKVFGQVVLHF